MKDNIENKKLVVMGDAEIKKNIQVQGVIWKTGELLELIRVVDKSRNGYYIEVMNASLGGIHGIVDSEKLTIRHQGRYKLIQSKFLGDAILLDASKIEITIPGRENVRWKEGDRLELVRVEKRLGEKYFEFEVINLTQGREIALVSSDYIKIENQRKFNSLVLKYFQ